MRTVSELLAVIWRRDIGDTIGAATARAEILRRARAQRERTLKRFTRLGKMQAKYVRRMRRVGIVAIVAGGYMAFIGIFLAGFLIISVRFAGPLGQYSLRDAVFPVCLAGIVSLCAYVGFALICAGVGFLDGREDARRRLIRALKIFIVTFAATVLICAVEATPRYRLDTATGVLIVITTGVIWLLQSQIRRLRSPEVAAWCLAHSLDNRETGKGERDV